MTTRLGRLRIAALTIALLVFSTLLLVVLLRTNSVEATSPGSHVHKSSRHEGGDAWLASPTHGSSHPEVVARWHRDSLRHLSRR
jgi:hypothetical protein